MKSKNTTSSDLTVDTYPSPSDDVLPVFCLDKLHPAIYHPVLLTSTIPSLHLSSSSSSSSGIIPNSSSFADDSGESSGDSAIDSSANIAASHTNLHPIIDGDESVGNVDDLVDVPSSLHTGGRRNNRVGGRTGGFGNGDGDGNGGGNLVTGSGSDNSATAVPAASSSTRSIGRKRANSQLRMPRGDSGRGIFAQACKQYVGKWEDAEWSDGPSVPKGDGIPGEFCKLDRLYSSTLARDPVVD